MSFINQKDGAVFAPGYFLATETDVVRQTREIAQDHSNVQVDDEGYMYVPGGSIYPSNDSDAEGIIYENVNVTSGNMPGSVVTRGTVYSDRLAEEISDDAVTALEDLGFVFVEEAPAVERPF